MLNNNNKLSNALPALFLVTLRQQVVHIWVSWWVISYHVIGYTAFNCMVYVFRYLEYKIAQIFKGEIYFLICWQTDKISIGWKN